MTASHQVAAIQSIEYVQHISLNWTLHPMLWFASRGKWAWSSFAALSALLVCISNGTANAEDLLPYGSRRGADVTVVSRSGIDSTEAVIKVEHTRENARAYCVGYVLDNSDACVEEGFRKYQLATQVTANCSTGSMTALNGESYVQAGHSKNEDFTYRFVNKATGQEPELFNEYIVVEAQFKALCPARLAADGPKGSCKIKGYENYPGYCPPEALATVQNNVPDDPYEDAGDEENQYHPDTRPFEVGRWSGAANKDRTGCVIMSPKLSPTDWRLTVEMTSADDISLGLYEDVDGLPVWLDRSGEQDPGDELVFGRVAIDQQPPIPTDGWVNGRRVGFDLRAPAGLLKHMFTAGSAMRIEYKFVGDTESSETDKDFTNWITFDLRGSRKAINRLDRCRRGNS